MLYLTVISEASAGLLASMYDTVVLACSAEAPAPMIDFTEDQMSENNGVVIISTVDLVDVSVRVRAVTLFDRLIRNFTLNHNGLVT
jgi:hypothetical protein